MARLRNLRPYARWLYELLFAAYCANFYATRLGFKLGFSLAGGLLSLVTRHGAVNARPSVANMYLAATLLVALFLFVCLRLLGRFRVSEWFLRYVSPIIVSAGPLNIATFENAPILKLDLHLRWFEVAVMAAILLAYQLRKRSFAVTAGTLLATVLHQWLWGWIMIHKFSPEKSDPWWWFRPTFTLLPFCTILAWVLYVRLSTNSGSRLSNE